MKTCQVYKLSNGRIVGKVDHQPKWNESADCKYSEQPKTNGDPVDFFQRGICFGWQGRLPLRNISTVVSGSLPEDPEMIQSVLQGPGRIFIYYVDRSRHANQNLERLRALASSARLLEEPLASVADRNNRPIYRVVHFVEPAPIQSVPSRGGRVQ